MAQLSNEDILQELEQYNSILEDQNVFDLDDLIYLPVKLFQGDVMNPSGLE